MKNMKKLLSALTALSFVTVAGVSTVACGPNDSPTPEAKMDTKVLADLGLYNAEGASLIEATIKNAEWNTAKLAGIDASKLLAADGKALSEESKTFLTAILKLEAKDDKFVAADAAKIKLSVGEIKPTLEKIKDDFAIKEGTVAVQWKDASVANLGSAYTLNLKGDSTKGVIASALPAADKMTLADFDTTKAPLDKFKVGEKKDSVQIGEITNTLKADAAVVKELQSLAKFVNQGDLKVTITAVNVKGDNFANGDSLTVKVNFGGTQFSTAYTLTLVESFYW
ncbi:hypothetical protein [Spiroplasma platyhelix]|uniref:Lipoprotein n=1 Tax=Spiroplasma platyhelix PALS-1 TaxID=1276218 RepID=A0A846U0M1_9MOLU|nr:hypothetical protein [Spiroplasma platyhelix]MBE4704004.1 hypothetical protein [Spiroplasma platyhelix PALS-1]NKE38376.1 hypothetical protein [Spiroplasma platyhelix PALS-1]UJB29262.1 hypothetical protein SPLAT_v1c04980 [Spiroplasma platyhelix PALS-1]